MEKISGAIRDWRRRNSVEQEMVSGGIFVFVNHSDTGEEIYLLEHLENLRKGIEAGEYGLPSETRHVNGPKKETITNLMGRWIREETNETFDPGVNLMFDPQNFCADIYFPYPQRQALSRGRMATAYGQVMVMHIAAGDKERFPTKFKTAETNGAVWLNVGDIINPGSDILFRRYPDTPQIIRQLSGQGSLNMPGSASVTWSFNSHHR